LSSRYRTIGTVGWGFDESCRWDGDVEEAKREKIAKYDISERVHYDHGRVRWESVGHVRWKGGRTTKRGGRNIYNRKGKQKRRRPLILGVERLSGQSTTPTIPPGSFGASFGGFGAHFSMAPFDGAFDDGDDWSFDDGLVDVLDLPLVPRKAKGKDRENVYILERGG